MAYNKYEDHLSSVRGKPLCPQRRELDAWDKLAIETIRASREGFEKHTKDLYLRAAAIKKYYSNSELVKANRFTGSIQDTEDYLLCINYMMNNSPGIINIFSSDDNYTPYNGKDLAREAMNHVCEKVNKTTTEIVSTLSWWAMASLKAMTNPMAFHGKGPKSIVWRVLAQDVKDIINLIDFFHICFDGPKFEDYAESFKIDMERFMNNVIIGGYISMTAADTVGGSVIIDKTEGQKHLSACETLIEYIYPDFDYEKLDDQIDAQIKYYKNIEKTRKYVKKQKEKKAKKKN